MKIILIIAAFSLVLAASGCVVYERRPTPSQVVMHPNTMGSAPQRVVTVLPVGYQTRVYRGTNYYYYDDVYYRPYPGGGYTVVERPW
jgi:outer membrane lipoprotein-sorting protein